MSDILFSVFPNENFVDIGLYQYGWGPFPYTPLTPPKT